MTRLEVQSGTVKRNNRTWAVPLEEDRPKLLLVERIRHWSEESMVVPDKGLRVTPKRYLPVT